MTLEFIDINKALDLGGTVYNHGGQIIMAGMLDELFLGDEFEEYSAMDALVRTILEYPKRFYISGEILKIEDDGHSLIITMSDLDTETVPYKWLDCNVLVNYNSELVTIKKSKIEHLTLNK